MANHHANRRQRKNLKIVCHSGFSISADPDRNPLERGRSNALVGLFPHPHTPLMKLLVIGLALLALLTPASFSQASPAPAPTVAPTASKTLIVTPDQAAELIKTHPKLIILDLRTPEEFGAGHIAGAINISSGDPAFAKKLAALEQSNPILVHCASGSRSGRMLPLIEGGKFPSIHHLNSGINGWKEAGKPVVK